MPLYSTNDFIAIPQTGDEFCSRIELFKGFDYNNIEYKIDICTCYSKIVVFSITIIVIIYFNLFWIFNVVFSILSSIKIFKKLNAKNPVIINFYFL